MTDISFGVDIGGTKIALTAGKLEGESVEILEKQAFMTIKGDVKANLEEILRRLKALWLSHKASAIGISCGGPLRQATGTILSPPNLPGWDEIPIVSILQNQMALPARLENDADACALAEFRYGAGRGIGNMIFLTFGTGMGAGLILNGRLYRGAGNCAGEAGHVRLKETGPVGFGKKGSFEGFCSGGGIAQLGRQSVQTAVAQGRATPWAAQRHNHPDLSAKDIFLAAQEGDAVALEVVNVCGEHLGRGLAVLVDILNPDRIIIGGIFSRNQGLLTAPMLAALKREALPLNLSKCRILPAGLGEGIGDVAALSVGFDILREHRGA